MYECKVAEKLVEFRALRGLTQEEVAQSLSVSNKTISKWENGASMPDLSMLVELSKYYGVTTDTLLGLAEEKKQSTIEEVCCSFEGLDRKESVLKAFEMVKSIIPALYSTLDQDDEDIKGNEEIFPLSNLHSYRSEILMPYFYEFTANSENVNVAVMMLRDKVNFDWLNNPGKQKEIVKLFKFLSNEDTLSVLYFIHSTSCSKSFTADYIAKNTDVMEGRVYEILEEFCSVGECYSVMAHLVGGTVKVYECYGDGVVLSLISLAFERMCGSKSYHYYLNNNCKMIGGKYDEFIS